MALIRAITAHLFLYNVHHDTKGDNAIQRTTMRKNAGTLRGFCMSRNECQTPFLPMNANISTFVAPL